MSYSSYGRGAYADSRYSSASENQSSKNSYNEVELTVQQSFNQHLLKAEQLVKSEDYEQAVNKLRFLLQKINMFKQNKKDYDKKLEMVCIYNLAAAFQKQWNLDECIPLLQKFIVLLRSSLQQNLKASGSLILVQDEDHADQVTASILRCSVADRLVKLLKCQTQKSPKNSNRPHWIVKAVIQKGFRRMQQNDNQKIILPIEKKQHQIDLETLKTHIEPKPSQQKTAGNDKIQFSYSVLLNARQILQQLVKMQTHSDIIDSNYSHIQTEMQDIKSKIYYWKSNPQNNIKMLRQSFNANTDVVEEVESGKKASPDRNLLGIKRNKSWIEEFTIAKIMFMNPLNYLEFSDSDNLIFQFNHRNIIEKVILLSVTYFSLSIELRFLQQQNQTSEKKTKTKSNSNSNSNNNLTIEKKKSEQQLQKSQIFHLKAIEIVCKHIKQNSAFVTHLVVNYHKHYKNNLNIIQEQNSLAQYSQLYDVRRHSKQPSSKLEDAVGSESLIQSTKNILNAPTSTYRKDSIYYTDDLNEEQPEKQKKEEKDDDPVFNFKKVNKKKLQDQEDKSQRSRKLGSSSSYSKFEQQLNSQKDKTMKKVHHSKMKMITIGKTDLKDLTDRSQKEQSSKQLSSSKQISMKSFDKKSLSKSKNFLKNSITLKQNKSHSPMKQRGASKAKKFNDLKESTDLSKRDFGKKKSPEPSRALDLLKRSGSLHQIQLKSSKDIGSIYTASNTLHLKKKR